MIELELLGIGADGESLVFTSASGDRYSTPITDELRGALRRERPQLDVVPEPSQTLKPSQIQTLLRGGMSAEEISAEHEVDLAMVQRFEPPIQAEKDYIVRRAQDSRVGGEVDAPRVGDLVLDRLATRGVQPSSVSWYASRQIDSPWQLSVIFLQGAAEHAAHWSFDPGRSALEAIDQEARWLTETVSTTPINTIFPPAPVVSAETKDTQALAADSAQREVLVDQLNAARGRRVEVDVEAEDADDIDAIMAAFDAEDAPADSARSTEADAPAAPSARSISARIYSLAQAKTKREASAVEDEAPVADSGAKGKTSAARQSSASVKASPSAQPSASGEDAGEGLVEKDAKAEAGADTLPGLDAMPVEEAPKEKRRTKRRSVPSWDEIVFGSKP